MSKQQNWKYVVSTNNEDSDDVTLTGPYEDDEAADEFVQDHQKFTGEGSYRYLIAPLEDSDALLAALKVEAKAAKKLAKKQAKKAAKAEQKTVSQTIEDGGKQKKKDKQKAAKAEQDADASDVAASPEGEAVVEPPADANGTSEAAVERITSEYKGSLADDKDKLIEGWSRGMTKHPVIGPLNLSPNQRRVIAALKWCREVNKSNAHMPGTVQPPAPIVGIDGNDRIVVAGLDGLNGLTGSPKRWAVLKNGDPADIKEPIRKLKQKVSESV